MSANINIRNFQSIKDADINVEGLTILVGESSQGKSACLRAINAACNNKFKQNFLRYGADTIKVAISYKENPNTLIVSKTKKESPTYELGDLVFQKLNRTVPDEVNEFNNYGVIDYFEQKYPLNYFSQFSKPLLLEFSQKRILEILSSSKAYDDMNAASTNLNKHKEQNNGAFKQLSSMLSDNKTQLSELKRKKEDIEGNIKKMREYQSTIEGLEGESESLDKLAELYGEYLVQEDRLDKLGEVERICAEYDKKEHLSGGVENLSNLIDEYQKYNNRLTYLEEREWKIGECRKIQKQIDDLKADKVDELSTTLNVYLKKRETLKTLTDKFDKITKVVAIKNEIRELDRKRDKLNSLSDLMVIAKSVQEDIKKKQYMVDNRICPVCGKPL